MEIRIGKTGRSCAACGREFVHGDAITSFVRMEANDFVRADFDRDCWTDERGADAAAVWNREYYDTNLAEQEPAEVFTPLRQAFYEAVEMEGRENLAAAYLAAQLLRRQKVFRLIKEAEDQDGTQRLALFTDRIGNRLIEVRDPNLRYDEIEAGRLLLMQRLAELEGTETDIVGIEPNAEECEHAIEK